MITVNGPNGVTVRFPDGTDQDTITRTMDQAIGAQGGAGVGSPRPTVPQASVPQDISNSVINNAEGGIIGLLGTPGNIATGVGNAVDWGMGLLKRPPAERAAISDVVRRTIPFIGLMPNVDEVAQGYNAARGAIGMEPFKPYQSQTTPGAYAGSITRALPYATVGALTAGASMPLSLGMGVTSGALGQAGGDVAATLGGEKMRPYGELGGEIVGGVAPAMGVRAVANAWLKRNAAPTTDLFTEAGNLFDAARSQGVAIKPDVMNNIIDRVVAVGKAKAADPDLMRTKDAWTAIQRLEARRSGGPVAPGLMPPPTDFGDVMTLREILRQAQGENGGAAASAMKAEFDDAINALTPNDVIGPNPQAAVDLLNRARPMWQQANKAADIDEIMRTSLPKDRLDQPGAYERAVEAGFARLVKDPNFTRFWTPQEQATIIAASQGGGIAPQLMRLFGKSKAIDLFGLLPVNVLRGAGNIGSRGAADVASATVRNPNPFLVPSTVPRSVQEIATALADLRSRQELASPPLLNVQGRP